MRDFVCDISDISIHASIVLGFFSSPLCFFAEWHNIFGKGSACTEECGVNHKGDIGTKIRVGQRSACASPADK